MRRLRAHLEYVHPWPNHIGMFVARAQGWYREAGLDVDLISDGWDRGTPAQLVAAGEYEMAPIRLGELLELRHSELPMVGVATLNQCQMGGIFTLASTGIHRFKDLEGKTVALPTVPRLVQMVKEAVAADGGDFSRINVVHTGLWEGDMRAVEKGYFDAVFSVLGWESMQGVQPFEDGVRLRFDDVHVAPHHSYFLCFSERFCEAEPQVVRDFLDATRRGYEFAARNPQEALNNCGSAMCNIDPAVLRASLDFMAPSWFTQEGQWGVINADLVRSYTQWMIAGDFTTASLEDIDGAVTNRFLSH